MSSVQDLQFGVGLREESLALALSGRIRRESRGRYMTDGETKCMRALQLSGSMFIIIVI